MTIETANRIINEQEDDIAALKIKLSEMEDERDVLQHTADELLKVLQRIGRSQDAAAAHNIAASTLADYHKP